MKFTIECTISGCGEEFEGTLEEAIKFAEGFRRHPEWPVSIWHDGEKVVQVFAKSARCRPWISRNYKGTC